MSRKASIKKELEKCEDDNSSLDQEPQDVALEVEVGSAEVTHVCTHCSTVCQSAVGLKRHIARSKCKDKVVETAEEQVLPLKLIQPLKLTLTCDQCPKKFRVEKSLEKHKKEAHSKTSVKCSHCRQSFPNKKKLSEHAAKSHQEVPQCQNCGREFTRLYHLKRHLQLEACISGEVVKRYKCKACPASFSRKDNLLSHLRGHIEPNFPSTVCKLCPKYLPSFSTLVRHYNRIHMNNKMECDKCGKVLRNRITFVKHLVVHGEKCFKCSKCPFRCKSQAILKRHSLKHEARKPLACAHCPATFIQSHELIAHEFKHTGSSPIVCHYCGDCFPTKITMNSHIARKHENKPMHCPYEGCRMQRRQFVNELSLHVHIKSHEQEGSYKCSHCDKTFLLKNMLRGHELTHQWEKPRRCFYCVNGRAYIRGDLLLRHLRIKHPDTFNDNLKRVRRLLGVDPEMMHKINQEEMRAMVNLFDALLENKLDSIENVGLQHINSEQDAEETEVVREDFNRVMNEEELADSLKMMIERLIDKETLQLLGWPDTDVDTILESVLQQCNVRVADSDKFPRVACLRENTKQLFLRVIEDSTISRMLNTRTVDEVIRHVVSASG